MGGSSLWPSPDTRLIGEPQRRSMIPCQGILRSAGCIRVLQESRVRILTRVPVKTLPSGTKLRWLASTMRVRSSCKCENITVHWLAIDCMVSLSHFSLKRLNEWERLLAPDWVCVQAVVHYWWVTPWFSEACYCIITIRSYNFAETPPTFLIHLSLCLQI